MSEFKEILRESGLTQKDFSELIGLTYHTVRKQLCYGGKRGARRIIPTWAKAFVIGFRLGVEKGEKNRPQSGNE